MDSETIEKARIMDHAYPVSYGFNLKNATSLAVKDEAGAALVRAVYESLRRMVLNAVRKIEDD